MVRDESGRGKRDYGDEEARGHGLAVMIVRKQHGGGVGGYKVPGGDTRGWDAAVDEHR